LTLPAYLTPMQPFKFFFDGASNPASPPTSTCHRYEMPALSAYSLTSPAPNFIFFLGGSGFIRRLCRNLTPKENNHGAKKFLLFSSGWLPALSAGLRAVRATGHDVPDETCSVYGIYPSFI
jgi:hypothetical protein